MNNGDRLLQIRRSHASARPKYDNPAWLHTHNDLAFVLERYDELLGALDQIATSDHPDYPHFAGGTEAEFIAHLQSTARAAIACHDTKTEAA